MKLSRTILRYCGVLTLLVFAAPSLAQDRVFVGGAEIGAFGRFGQKLADVPSWVHGARAGGGRYFVVDDFSGVFAVVDARTGATIPVPGRVLAVDPVRPRLFFYDSATRMVFLLHIPTGLATPLLSAEEVFGTFGERLSPEVRYAPVSDEVFIRRQPPSTEVSELVVLEATTAQIRRTMADPSTWTNGLSGYGFSWIVTEDGTRLFGRSLTRTFGGSELTSVDAVSGVVLGRSPAPLGLVIEDPLFQRVIVRGSSGQLTAFDRLAQPVGSMSVGPCAAGVAISPHTGRIYVTYSVFTYFDSTTWLTALDGSTGRQLDAGAGVLNPGESNCGDLRVEVLTAPGPPRDLRAQVNGSTVDLSWVNVGGASHFVLDAGFAPGQTALSIPLDASGRATFTNVPAGTYHVRVRGGNEFGGGRPSAETVVVVR